MADWLQTHLKIEMPYGHYGCDSEFRLHWAAQTAETSVFLLVLKRNIANF